MSFFLEKGKPSQRTDAGNDSDMEVRNCNKPVYSVMLYHAYFKAGERPYVEKKFEGCVVAHAGVHICYPRVLVESEHMTFCLRLGKTLSYFNPHTNNPFTWQCKQKTVCKLK